jgi:hypothetical protein
VDSAVTIVLPVHNAERTLRPMITRILDLAAAPTRRLMVAIVDDGSTDETFEAACELARDYPQVRVFRQPYQQGLGPALEQVRLKLSVEEVIVHDGVGPIDLDELSHAGLRSFPCGGDVHDAPDRGSRGRGGCGVAALNAGWRRHRRGFVPLASPWRSLLAPAESMRASAARSRFAADDADGESRFAQCK